MYGHAHGHTQACCLQEDGKLTAPLCCDIGMGGGEAGLLKACDDAASANADALVTIGGGAVQDAGKIMRMWLARSMRINGVNTVNIQCLVATFPVAVQSLL